MFDFLLDVRRVQSAPVEILQRETNMRADRKSVPLRMPEISKKGQYISINTNCDIY